MTAAMTVNAAVETSAETQPEEAPKVKFSDASEWPNPGSPHKGYRFSSASKNHGMLDRMFAIGAGGDVC